MTFAVAAAVIGGGALVGGFLQSDASRKAANTQAQAAADSAVLQKQMFDENTARMEPWRVAGVNALAKLVPLSESYQTFGMDQFKADPGYEFRRAEGQRMLERSASARGGLLSGSTLRGLTELGQNLASQEYTNAFNRFQTERAARLAPLQALAGVGQTTATQIGTMGSNMAQQVGDATQAQAQARASGYMGQANALTGAIGNALNAYGGYQAMQSPVVFNAGGSGAWTRRGSQQTNMLNAQWG